METSKIYFVGCSIALVFAIFVLAAISQQHFVLEINSDYLYPFETALNFLQNKTVAGQNVPAAPYYFPDLLLIMLLNSFTHSTAVLHYVYSVLFLMAYVVFVFRLMQLTTKNYPLAAMGTLIALAQCFFLIAPDFNFLREWPGSHLSVILFSLWFLHFYLVNRDRQKIPWAPLFLLTFLMFISDNLVFAQLFFPFAILLSIHFYKRQNSRPTVLKWLGLLLIVVLLGAKISVFFEQYLALSSSDNVSLFRIRKFVNIDQSIAHLLHFFAVSIRERRTVYAILLVDVLISVAWMMRHRQKKSSFFEVNTLLLFFCIAEISNVVLALLVGKLTDVAYFRYLATLYFFPPIGMALVIVNGISSQLRALRVGLLVSACNIGLGAGLYPPFVYLKEFNLRPLYNSSIECIDGLQRKFAIKNGLANYWSVRPVRMLSRTGVTTAQINRDLKFTNFVDNQSHFSARSYQFIIVNKLSSEKIENAIGKPDKIVVCGDEEVWLYVAKDSNIKMNRYFLTQQATV